MRDMHDDNTVEINFERDHEKWLAGVGARLLAVVQKHGNNVSLKTIVRGGRKTYAYIAPALTVRNVMAAMQKMINMGMARKTLDKKGKLTRFAVTDMGAVVLSMQLMSDLCYLKLVFTGGEKR